ncbi:DUF3016 domain-containing protein [Parashewanella spongiae]|uniref:DUF3016 domain-containing protein n=1 Tax=Parashewanella spongiae TaxID=342950 RepID=A0A3A6U1F1_9GAMM|nr:DUF3016 domain-containing protein [Parashewanella spongiae]MCL1078876.1 DUF3016 domain-containing protein [Parashewanella spongiae]RJY17848.1 DUF3016 domain-containing protein [Parashewanella spongiae]
MKKALLTLIAITFSGSIMAHDTADKNPITQDGAVTITWKDPTHFRDIKSSGERQSRFQNRLFETLTKNINKLTSNVLKENQTISLEVTNLDLAGDVRPTFSAASNDIRVIKNIYPPRITFSYKVLEGKNEVFKGDEKLSDLAFMDTIHNAMNKPFNYETKLLKNWVNRTLKEQLSQD